MDLNLSSSKVLLSVTWYPVSATVTVNGWRIQASTANHTLSEERKREAGIKLSLA